ncbi:DUF2306 domain-containing protein [Myxococcus sp. K15C18031901]|uniref:DUF2306 domain-containing protein n=1 Tax=Myxococcus dinghuensis TaxID=2906761 RepID=UPI0020A80DD9|nr:DUF2306 domain-containing protein [Myxococcus dinghuensis]MCP3097815.1 DUF2306 domain-containing protein [Myxococcus dinghuensis]
MASKACWVLFAALCLAVGLYPSCYFLEASNVSGLRAMKGGELLADPAWNAAFYTHIALGGLALAIGWTQFVARLRLARPGAHRLLGKVYVGAVFLSGLAGVYVGFFATGGVIAAAGFVSLGAVWLSTTASAWWLVMRRRFEAHRLMMTYSYSVCFAAVTLRLWMPVLMHALGDFIPAYRIVAWLCWVPNLGVAYLLSRRPSRAPELAPS